MNGAYYLATLNCKETRLGDDLPAPLAGVTLGSAITTVLRCWRFFWGGHPPKTNGGGNLKIPSRGKGEMFRNHQFFGSM